MNRATVAYIVIVLSLLACVAPPWAANSPVLTVTATATKLPTVTPKPVPTVFKSWKAEVKLPTVNLRAEPSGRVIGSLTVGTIVEVAECVGNWCRIKKPAGWVWRGCLTDNPEKKGCVAK